MVATVDFWNWAWTALCFIIFDQFLFSVALIPPLPFLTHTLDTLTQRASCFFQVKQLLHTWTGSV